VLPWLLIVGGGYLCFEGAEKVLEWFGFHHGGHDDEGGRDEKRLVMGAIRTDLILSTEIMLIGLSNVDPDLDFWLRLAVLAVIALSMTALVYGAVALLVKIDDIGLKMAKSGSVRVRHTGTRIVRSMPAVFRVISIVGTVAMLWVGGHLVLANLGEVGWHAPVELLHAVEHALEPSGPWSSGSATPSCPPSRAWPWARDRRHRADHRQGLRRTSASARAPRAHGETD
jgi:predicted DNA repair protein MutK